MIQNEIQDEMQNTAQSAEFQRFENVTEILRFILVNEQTKDNQYLKDKTGLLYGRKSTFEGQIGAGTYFLGKEVSTDNTHRTDSKLFANLFDISSEKKEKGSLLCSIYRRWDLLSNKTRPSTKESIIVKTPKATKGQHVVTRVNGSPLTGAGILYVVHTPEENANTFIDQLCNVVLRDKRNVITPQKLRRLKIDGEMMSTFDKNFMQDHDNGYKIR